MLKTGKYRKDIEKYLKGEMSKAEVKIFEAKLHKYPKLKEEVEARKLLLKHGEDEARQVFLKNLKMAGKKYRAEYIDPSHRPDTNTLLILIGFVSLLLGITLVIWIISS